MGTVAHLVALRREAIGRYNVTDAWTVEQLQAAVTEMKLSKAQSRAADMDTQLGNATDTASACTEEKASNLTSQTAAAPE